MGADEEKADEEKEEATDAAAEDEENARAAANATKTAEGDDAEGKDTAKKGAKEKASFRATHQALRHVRRQRAAHKKSHELTMDSIDARIARLRHRIQRRGR